MRAIKRTVSVLLSLMLVLGMVTMGISVASAAENTISATSNIAATATQTYTAGSGQVTVNYSLQSPKRIVDGQGVITYDTNVLKLADCNTKNTFYPNLSGGMVVVNLDKTDGRIPFNFSNLNTYDFSTSKVMVSVVFDVIGSGNTTVNLNMDCLTATNTTSGQATDAAQDVIIIGNGVNDQSAYSASAEETISGNEVDPSVFIYNVTVALEGKIGLNYFFYQNPVGYEGKEITVRFNGPELNETENVTKALTSMNVIKRSGVSYYNHTYNLYADMMSQPVEVQIYADGEYVTSYTTSVKDWSEANLPKNETSNPKVAKLIKDMLNYGAAAQIAFNSYTDKPLPNANINYALVPITADTIQVPAGLNVNPNLSSIGLNFDRMTAELKDGTAIRVYGILANETLYNANKNVTITSDFDSETGSFSGSGSRKMVVKDNIASDRLDDVYTFTFANGATYKTSVMSFVKNLLQALPDNEAYVNLGSA
ncbi:MAG: hypothetical protein II573_02460, partial [Ruminococcus sp.]|nr:hypothetical protein [Ruminococcus sp.]